MQYSLWIHRPLFLYFLLFFVVVYLSLDSNFLCVILYDDISFRSECMKFCVSWCWVECGYIPLFLQWYGKLRFPPVLEQQYSIKNLSGSNNLGEILLWLIYLQVVSISSVVFGLRRGCFDLYQFCHPMIVLTQFSSFSHVDDKQNLLKSTPVFVCLILPCLFVWKFPRVTFPA